MKTIKHLNPIWKEKANYLIGAHIPPIKNYNMHNVWEQLWSQKLSNKKHEICCIPFFVYNLALGDIVETDSKDFILKVIEPSQHTTYRLWFYKHISENMRNEVLDSIKQANCLYEFYSLHLLGIDVDSKSRANDLEQRLIIYQKDGILSFEIGSH